ncbi:MULTISPECIES: DUF1616 domain-containing protein [Halorussus]|uniref:DUF1616 domain-containing protein n=1 Tax=Halorussus TaxID=1070314 RepID=UPI000E2194E1|nr:MULTISPECIES: DUF1616 domain-containing protein [Halorussus]NHN61432.1 DUF1616 domain-containing protein [Halorussus sp. JP-T4]
MVDARKLWLMVPRGVRTVPSDLAAVVGLVALTWVAVEAPVVRGTLLRAVVGSLFVLAVPGYAFTAALFPEANDPDEARATLFPRPGAGIDIAERAVFSFGLSVTTVPLLAFALNFTPWGVSQRTMLLAVSGLAVGLTAVAVVRRRRVPAEDRFRVPYGGWSARARGELLRPSGRFDAVLNAVIIASVLVGAGSVAYAVAGPGQDQSFTEFYVATENESGALVADGYPTQIRRGQTETVVVGIGNHENEPQAYTGVVRLQRVRTTGNASEVVATRRLGTFDARLAPNETVVRTQRIRPSMTGRDLKVQFLLYRGSPPANPTGANAYRRAHFWTNVTAGPSAG